MLTPDYQEFANRRPCPHRDNPVILGSGTPRNRRNLQALRDYHGAGRARRQKFLPIGGDI